VYLLSPAVRAQPWYLDGGWFVHCNLIERKAFKLVALPFSSFLSCVAFLLRVSAMLMEDIGSGCSLGGLVDVGKSSFEGPLAFMLWNGGKEDSLGCTTHREICRRNTVGRARMLSNVMSSWQYVG
jgi:hypothetical protein